MFSSKEPKRMAREVRDAYRDRIKVMSIYGEDSPEGLVAEVVADDLADEFRAQTGRDWKGI